MGQNWWWVVLAVLVVVAVLVVLLVLRRPRGRTEAAPPSDVEIAAAAAGGAAGAVGAAAVAAGRGDKGQDRDRPPVDTADTQAPDGASTPGTRPGPHAGSVLPAADGSAPSSDYPVKANEGSRRYHTPDSPYYVRTRADVWFRTAQDAQAAGFTAWNTGR